MSHLEQKNYQTSHSIRHTLIVAISSHCAPKQNKQIHAFTLLGHLYSLTKGCGIIVDNYGHSITQPRAPRSSSFIFAIDTKDSSPISALSLLMYWCVIGLRFPKLSLRWRWALGYAQSVYKLGINCKSRVSKRWHSFCMCCFKNTARYLRSAAANARCHLVHESH